MKKTIFLGTVLLLTMLASAQNFSNLLNKKLNKIDDVGSVIESGLGSLLGGKIKGDIDSVVVVNDSERELHLKIFYRGFENAFFKLSTTDPSKQKQNAVKKSEFSLTGKSSPLTCVMTLSPDYPKGQLLESPFLKLEFAKDASKPGQVATYSLNKKWKIELNPENVVINIKPQPVGNTANLKPNEVKDVNASKPILFDASKLYYNHKLDIKTVSAAQSSSQPATKPSAAQAKPMMLNTVILTPILINQPAGSPAPDLSPKGPDKQPYYLWTGLTSDNPDIERPQDISNINMSIFRDKEQRSGVFYYLPADYHLKYEPKDEPEKGYNLTIDYGGRNAGTETAPVRMSAKLTAGMTTAEIQFIERLLKARIPEAKELRPLPLAENPVFSFQTYLTSQYNIPQNKIAVESSTDLSNDIRVAWQTDADTKEFMQVALTSGEGIAASVVLKPQAPDIIEQQIPVTINLADSRTLGKITLDKANWRNRNWKNNKPYPLQLRHLNILKISQTTKAPIIYSWSLDNTVVPPKAQVKFDASLVPAWLDTAQSMLMWIDYSVVECRPCNDKVVTAVTRGVSGNTVQMVKFTIPPAVFDTLNASYFMVSIRSKQVDPNGETVKELPTTLKITRSEDREFSAGPLYVPTGSTISFEYKLRLATTDSEFVEAAEWIPATEKEIFLGKARMKEIFSTTNRRQ
jgi:hypothetical protein